MDVNVHQWINELPHLRNEIYESMKHIFKFKADMYYVYVRACKDPAHALTSLHFISMDDVVNAIVHT